MRECDKKEHPADVKGEAGKPGRMRNEGWKS